jgi:outer membrane receptor for ferric coprogen and ferric-rhodotorulic acid
MREHHFAAAFVPRAWATAFWLMAATSLAHAQPAPPADAASAQTITVTGTRTLGYQPAETPALGVSLPAQQLPASVNITNAEFLRDFNIEGLNDLANYIPSVTQDTKKPKREWAAEGTAAFGNFGYRKLGVGGWCKCN